MRFGNTPSALSALLSLFPRDRTQSDPLREHSSLAPSSLRGAPQRGKAFEERGVDRARAPNGRKKTFPMRPVVPVLPRPPTPVPASVAVAAAATEAGHQALMVATTVVWMMYKTPVISGEGGRRIWRAFFLFLLEMLLPGSNALRGAGGTALALDSPRALGSESRSIPRPRAHEKGRARANWRAESGTGFPSSSLLIASSRFRSLSIPLFSRASPSPPPSFPSLSHLRLSRSPQARPAPSSRRTPATPSSRHSATSAPTSPRTAPGPRATGGACGRGRRWGGSRSRRRR